MTDTQSKISKSLSAFVNKIIDYAGLFPPAKLELNKAFDNYIVYKNDINKWMLSRFICPAKLLPDLTVLILNNYSIEKEIALSILGSGGNSEQEFKNNFKTDLNNWTEFFSKFKNEINTNVFEIKLPNETIATLNKNRVQSLIDFVSDSVQAKISEELFIFFEGSMDNEWKKNIRTLTEGIILHNVRNNNCGFKLRTGGTDAASFPSPEQISHSIRDCLDKEIIMKCTAGLHHPFTHFDKSIKTVMYGFINVFGAGIISRRHNISDIGMNEILCDENRENFIFTDDYFSWKDWKIGTEDISFARTTLMNSFGSCSFDEPLDDLKSYNLL